MKICIFAQRLSLSAILFFFNSFVHAESVSQQLTFDFQTIQVSSALQLLADYRGLNLVLDENVRGSLSMRMRDVSWDEAIEYVTSAKGLLYTVEGNFLRVSAYPRSRDSYSESSYGSSQNQQSQIGLSSGANAFDISILKVHNILASDAIKAFPLDSGENLSFEDGSSIIVARMSKPRLDQLKTLISAVDYSRKQVMIQARIVQVDRSYSKNLGVQWGGTIGSGSGAVSGSVPLGFSSGAVGAVGIVSSALTLDARLSAMEQEGRGKVISSPRVYTSDRHQAKIVKGSQVPYQQSAGDGATSTSFKQAALSLDVTPIVNDKGVLLDVILSKDEPDYSNAMNGVPPINTTSLTSRVFSPFGQTIAVGGVYSDLDTTVVKSVPFLGKIPGFKWLFTSSSTVSTSTELVLFLTPVLVDRL